MTLNRLIATIFFVMLAATAFAQDEQQIVAGRPPVDFYRFEFTGGGARAEGMGKAYLGLSDDVTASGWNPAGLFELSSPTVSISYGASKARGWSNSGFTIFDPRSDQVGAVNGISSLNFASPIRIKGHAFVGSVAYTRNFNEFQSAASALAFDQPFITKFPNGAEDTSFFNTIVDSRSDLEGGLVSMNLALGTKINEHVSAGIAMNIYTGESVRDGRSVVSIPELLDLNTLQTTSRQTISEVIDTNKFSGFNVTLGTQYRTEKLGVGLVVRTPFALSIETGRSIYSVATENGLPTVEGSDTVFFDGLLAKYDIPLTIAGGVGYQLGENTTLAADVEYRGFSGKRVRLREQLILEPGGDNTEVFSDTIPNWNNSFSVRVGGEHRFDTRFGTVPIRLGFGYVPLIAPNYNAKATEAGTLVNPLDINNFEQSSTASYSYSGGFGVHWEQIRLDWAYTYTRYDWGNWQGALFDNLNRDHNINFTFTGVF